MGSVDHRVRSTPRTTVRHRIPVPTSTTSLERRGPAPTVDVLPRGGGGLWGPIDRRAAFARAHRRSRASRRSSSGIHRLNRTVLIHSATHTQRSRRTASSICVARPGVFPETRRSFFFPAGRNFFGRSRPRKGAAAARISVVGTFKPGTVGSFGRESWVSRDVDARRQPIICHTGVSHLGNRIPLGRRSLTLEFKRNNFPGLKPASSTGGAYEVSQSDKVFTL